MQVCFVKPETPPFDLAFNKLAAMVTRGAYCHTEVAFDALTVGDLRELKRTVAAGRKSSELDRIKTTLTKVLEAFPPDVPSEHEVTLAFHALAGCPLGVRVLSEHAADLLYMPYGEGWKVYKLIGAPANVVQTNLVWCLSKVSLPYDTMGALTSPWRASTGSCSVPDPEAWFCSNHALRFVQHLNLCSEMSMWGTTPNRLEEGLRQYKEVDPTCNEEEPTSGVVQLTFDKPPRVATSPSLGRRVTADPLPKKAEPSGVRRRRFASIGRSFQNEPAHVLVARQTLSAH